MPIGSHNSVVRAPLAPVLPTCNPPGRRVLPRFMMPFRQFLPTDELKLSQPGVASTPMLQAQSVTASRLPVGPNMGTAADRLLERRAEFSGNVLR